MAPSTSDGAIFIWVGSPKILKGTEKSKPSRRPFDFAQGDTSKVENLLEPQLHSDFV
jgi:hypothetical protein